MEDLGLLGIQVEGGRRHSTEEAIQVVMDYLTERVDDGDARAELCAAMLAGVSISMLEFGHSVSRVPGLLGLLKAARDKSFGGTTTISGSEGEGQIGGGW